MFVNFITVVLGSIYHRLDRVGEVSLYISLLLNNEPMTEYSGSLRLNFQYETIINNSNILDDRIFENLVCYSISILVTLPRYLSLIFSILI